MQTTHVNHVRQHRTEAVPSQTAFPGSRGRGTRAEENHVIDSPREGGSRGRVTWAGHVGGSVRVVAGDAWRQGAPQTTGQPAGAAAATDFPRAAWTGPSTSRAQSGAADRRPAGRPLCGYVVQGQRGASGDRLGGGLAAR
jgi:hypothetical protein